MYYKRSVSFFSMVTLFARAKLKYKKRGSRVLSQAFTRVILYYLKTLIVSLEKILIFLILKKF